MGEPGLSQKVTLINTALDQAAIAHAFGGALALIYYGEPRVTDDIDINIFLPADDHARLEEALDPLGVSRPADPSTLLRDGQVRVRWGRHPVDVFYAYDPFHDAMARSFHRVPFMDATIPILSPEHLVVCKVVFNRGKDWIDMEQLLVSCPDLDLAEVRHWIDRIAGPDAGPYRRFEALASEILGPFSG